MEHDDDKPVGRVLSRRSALALFGLAGVGVGALGGTAARAADNSSGRGRRLRLVPGGWRRWYARASPQRWYARAAARVVRRR